jgi:MFS family permease
VADVQWVVTAYLLALAAAIPFTGWAVARFGGRRMWLVSLALFLGGSALCAVAWNIGALIALRALQGFGAGLMIPIMQTLLVQAAHGRPLGRLMATISLPALVGPIFGPVIGGLIVGHASWRWVLPTGHSSRPPAAAGFVRVVIRWSRPLARFLSTIMQKWRG